MSETKLNLSWCYTFAAWDECESSHILIQERHRRGLGSSRRQSPTEKEKEHITHAFETNLDCFTSQTPFLVVIIRLTDGSKVVKIKKDINPGKKMNLPILTTRKEKLMTPHAP
jgi:hypothetical protein